MHALHQYISKQIGEALKRRRIALFYDLRRDFSPYFDELKVIEAGNGLLSLVEILGVQVCLARFDGSFFGLRAKVEPLTCMDEPSPLLIYLPGATKDRKGSLLMELEIGGEVWEPRFKQIARIVLGQKYTDGQIDGMLAPESLTYADIVTFLWQESNGEAGSLIKLIFGGVSDGTAILSSWLTDASKDSEISEKNAVPELYSLVGRLGLTLQPETSLTKARMQLARYAFVNEFRADLDCEPPTSVSMIPACPTKEHLERTMKLLDNVRRDYPECYIALADEAELSLGLGQILIEPSKLGKIDTFRFEEKTLLKYCGELLANRDYQSAMKLITQIATCFWVNRDVSRRAQWEACRLIAVLGRQIQEIRPAITKNSLTPDAWVRAYASDEGWCSVDRAHRTLETWVSRMDNEPEAENALGAVRQEYEDFSRSMAEAFSSSFRKSQWAIPQILHQTRIFPDLIKVGGERTAYLLVDAMRFEMGLELAGLLADSQELTIKPAITALPTITPVGMAALLPEASASFAVVQHKDGLASRIEGSILANANDRIKFLKARVPDMVELTLGKLLESSTSKLAKTISDAPLVIVRSQEIDALGEGGDDWMARQVMDTVIGNLARAVRKLAGCGICRFVISADHGFQFSSRKGEEMRMDSPGGDIVELHRRCWVGRGGATPRGAVRVSGAELGYDTDLDFIFPLGLGVFRTSGGLQYHHGGISLQELVVPVISLRLAASEEKPSFAKVKILNFPKVITNRTIGIELACDPHMFRKDPITVRVILVSKGEQVGQTGMVDSKKATFDRTTGCITFQSGEKVSVGLMLNSSECETLRIVVQDPVTDGVLAQSDELPVKLGIR